MVNPPQKQKRLEEELARPDDKLKLVARKPANENQILLKINELVDLTLDQLGKDRRTVLGVTPKKAEGNGKTGYTVDLVAKAYAKLDNGDMAMVTAPATETVAVFVRQLQQAKK
ncbi:MAG: hypothetical protein WCT31_00440 [Candidatus Micrarchaeia archaeon]|jgi:hypothetical protein